MDGEQKRRQRVREESFPQRVVGGFETLTAMENVESDPKTDRPKEEIRIEATTVFVDPYEEADAQGHRCPFSGEVRSRAWHCSQSVHQAYDGLLPSAHGSCGQQQVAAEREKVRLEEEAAKTKAEVVPPKKEVQAPKTYRQGIGKYINMAAAKRSVEDNGPSTSTATKKEKKSTGFGDFSSW
ncbi:peptidyl-prolyl cis-trans isomerasehypothetical protein [Limosa lapponica baueri]|uniref:Uncharacterized protein n=1 Tax=Limosa lapponica baueri TaxID=1758121 RepID=A0A2I0TRZ8_LIMLA|nr:peptidyl-prolyl cis-trans isomerasehypothetical protein [Limosa lapponica baueri]